MSEGWDFNAIKDAIFGVTDRVLDFRASSLDHTDTVQEVYGPPAASSNWSNPAYSSTLPSWLPWAVAGAVLIYAMKGK